MRKRLILTLIAVCWFAAPSGAEAQCRKEVIVYLDISGSMRPTDRDPMTSPFARTVEALDALLEVADFVGDEDVVNVRLFGSTVRGGLQAKGPRELSSLVARLRQNSTKDPLTDFVLLADDAAAQLSGDSPFERRLVIIASDFVHEHRLSQTRENYLEDWSRRVRGLDFDLDDVFKQTEELALRFFVLPPWTPRGREATYFQALQNSVLDGLGADEDSSVALDVLSPGDLAKAIQASLLYEPVISGFAANGRDPELRVRIENQNCQPVRLEYAGAYCPARGGDAVGFDLGGRSVELAARGNQGAVFEQSVTLERISCQVDDEIEIIARFEGDVQKRERINATNRLWAKPAQGTFESSALGKSLNLYLDLRGQILTQRSYELELRGARGVLAAGRFEVPRSLSEEYQTYLFSLKVHESLISGDRNELEVVIADADMEESAIEIYRNHFGTWVNGIFVSSGLVLFLFSVVSSFSPQQKKAFSDTASLLANWGPYIAGPLALLLYDFVRAGPLSITWDFWLRWALLALCFGGVVYLWLRQRHLTRLDLRIENLFESQDRAALNTDGEGDMAAVNAAVDRVKLIVDMAGRKLRIVCLAIVAAVTLAGVAWLAQYLFRPAAALATPQVREVIEVVQS